MFQILLLKNGFIIKEEMKKLMKYMNYLSESIINIFIKEIKK